MKPMTQGRAADIRPTVPTALVLFKLARRQLVFANAHAYQLLALRQGDTDGAVRMIIEEFGGRFASGAASVETGEINGTWRTASGSHLNYILYPISESDGLLIFRDEAHMMQVQRERLLANRLETVGRLTSLVSGEILAPLKGIADELRALADSLPRDQMEARMKARDLHKQVNLIGERGAKLYDFTQHLDVKPAGINLLELLAFIEVVMMESPEWQGRAMDVHIQPDDLALYGDFHLLAQAVINLIRHGLRYHAPEARQVALRVTQAADHVQMTIDFRPAVTGAAYCKNTGAFEESMELAEWILRSHKATLSHDPLTPDIIRVEFYEY